MVTKDLYVRSEKIIRNKKGKIKKVIFTLSNGTKITAEACYESWHQWGGNNEELWVTVPRLEELNPEFDRSDYE